MGSPTAYLDAKLRERVFERTLLPIVVMDGKTQRIVDCNPAAAAVYGLPSVADTLGKVPIDLSPVIQYDGTPSAEKASCFIAIAKRQGSVVFEWHHRRPDGTLWDAEVHLLSFREADEEFFQFSLVDITERKAADKLKRIQRDLILQLNACTDVRDGLVEVLEAVLQLECIDCGGIYVFNSTTNSLDIVTHKGLSKEFVGAVSHFDDASPNFRMAARGEAQYGQYAKIGQQHDLIRDREGLLALASIPIMAKGQLIALLNVASHKIERIPEATRQSLETIAYQIGGSLLRLQSDAALRESEEIFSQFMENSPVYIFFKDDHIRSLRLSRNFEKMLGRPMSDLLGKTMDELFPSDLAKKMIQDDLEILAQGKPRVLEEELNGRYYTTIKFPIHIENKPRFLAGYTIDITEHKQSEEALRNVQKLEALSLLAGGIAHDFNNLLGGVFGYVDLARLAPSTQERDECLDRAFAAIGRARALTQQLLTFAKGGAPVKKVQRLDPFLRDAVQFALSGSSVSCRFDIASDLWQSEFDGNQLGQVVDNIVINAHQAMSNGGTIDVQARNVDIAEAEGPLLPKGKYVKISVRDAGIGIPREYLSRIFDPFFTTKPQGHGLGLSTCYSIVTRHGGCINVESEPGRGSVFHVLLPACVSGETTTSTKAKTKHAGSGLFVVMDDEPLIRDAIGRMLKSFGYTPLLVENGQQAIDCLQHEMQANQKVVGMVFDLTVPGEMGGKEAALEIRRICPEMPIFVASGYADDPVMARPSEYRFNASICKPFVRDDLAQLLNRHLRSKP